MINSHVQRAALLMQQQRWDLAEGELRQALAAEHDNADAHRLLSLCHLAREQLDAAEQEARAAIHLAPGDADVHRTMAAVLFHRRRFAESQAAVKEAIRLNPHNADSFALLSQLCQQQSDWRGMLGAANLGLQVDAEDADCNNLRAIALVKLGRRDEAGRTIAAALSHDPDNSLTHANEGWRLLEDRQRAEAMDHFREALRLDPQNEWARAGIVEGLKSKNIVYRLLLGYFLYMSRLKGRLRWGLMIGAYLLVQFGNRMATAHPAAAPFIQPFIFAYAAFVVLTWLGSSIFNLLLLLDKSGRHALSSDQKRGAVTVGLILLTALILAALWLVLGFASKESWIVGLTALFVALTAIPASSIFSCSLPWPRWAMAGATASLCVLGLTPIGMVLLNASGVLRESIATSLALGALRYFLYAFIGSQLLAMTLRNVQPQR